MPELPAHRARPPSGAPAKEPCQGKPSGGFWNHPHLAWRAPLSRRKRTQRPDGCAGTLPIHASPAPCVRPDAELLSMPCVSLKDRKHGIFSGSTFAERPFFCQDCGRSRRSRSRQPARWSQAPSPSTSLVASWTSPLTCPLSLGSFLPQPDLPPFQPQRGARDPTPFPVGCCRGHPVSPWLSPGADSAGASLHASPGFSQRPGHPSPSSRTRTSPLQYAGFLKTESNQCLTPTPRKPRAHRTGSPCDFHPCRRG